MQRQPAPEDLLSQAQRRLAAGDDAQAILEDVLGQAITPRQRLDPPDVAWALRLLSNHATPIATSDPDCVFARLICQGPINNAEVIYELADLLSHSPDELPYHVLLRHSDFPFSSGEIAQDPHTVQSLRRRDPRGRTASHFLWDEHSSLIEQSLQAYDTALHSFVAGLAMQSWLASCRHAWIIQSQLQSLGVGMEIPDHDGVTALDLAAQRLANREIVLCADLEICKRVPAWQSGSALQASTALPTTHAGSQGPRL